MKDREGGWHFTQKLSEVSSHGNDPKHLNQVVDQTRSHATSSSSSSSISRDQWLRTIINGGAESSSTGNKQAKRPNIPKVPDMVRKAESNKDCYDPLVVSIGPYHHGKSELQDNEELKFKMAGQYVKGSGTSIEALYKKVEEVACDARNYYDIESSAFAGESFTRMMFVDGCFLLQFIYLLINSTGNQKRQDLGALKNNVIVLVLKDLFLLENQLPFIVLEALMGKKFSKTDKSWEPINKFIKHIAKTLPPPEKSRPRRCCIYLCQFISYIIREFISCIIKPFQKEQLPTTIESRSKNDQPPTTTGSESDQPLHLLDMMRKRFIGSNAKETALADSAVLWSQKYQSAKELTTVGIRFRANNSGFFTDVRFAPTRFVYGKVTLPRLIIDESTKCMLLNLLALETCSKDPVDAWVTSYICFMDSLINNAEDVTVLRNQNILVNCLSSDQDVADLFNGIAKNLAPDPWAYVQVKDGIWVHSKNKFKTWMTEWLDGHFSSPWTILAFLGAIFAIILSVLQTYAALRPQPTPPKQ